MKKILQKSLASMVSAALCLTAFVSCLTVSATRGTGAFTVESPSAKPGESVTVPVVITSNDDSEGIAAAIFDLTFNTNVLTPTAVAAPSTELDYGADYRSNDGVGIYVDVDAETGLGTMRVLAFLKDSKAAPVPEMTANITFTVAAEAAVGATPITLTNAQACDYGTADSNGIYASDEDFIDMTIVNGAVTVTSATTEPVLDPSLKDTLNGTSMTISNKFGIYFKLYLASVDYDDFEFVVTKKEVEGANYSYTGNTISKTFTSADNDQPAYTPYHLYYFNYSEVGMYEMCLDVTYTLYIIKNGVKVSYFTFDPISLANVANAYYTQKVAENDLTTAAIVADILNLATAAKNHFATIGNSGSNVLASIPDVNTGIDQSLASKYGTLSEIEGTRDAAITTSLQLLATPSFWYKFYDASCTTPADMTFTASYYSKATDETISRTVNGADMDSAENAYASYGMYYFSFDKIALYDCDKTITLTVANTNGSSWTHEYSMESFLATKINQEGTAGDVYRAVAALSAGAHNKWPTY